MSSNNINDHIQWDENGSKSYALSGKIMLSAIIILFVVVIFMITLHIYARWYLLSVRRRYLHRRRTRRRQRTTHILFYVDPNAAASVPTRGLDPSVLDSLLVFVYSSLTHPDGLDCAVCLSEFEDNEKGRILPKCHHSFHTECIDMWFHSHSTCPICRTPVEAETPVQAPQNNNRSELVVSIDQGLGSESAGSSSAVCSCDPTEGGSMGTKSLADRRKGLDLVGVRIEVPRRSESVDELRLSSPASHGHRSPGNRLQSLKRILSINRKSAAVSPSSGIGPSCGSVGGELTVELGKYESTHGQTRPPTPRPATLVGGEVGEPPGLEGDKPGEEGNEGAGGEEGDNVGAVGGAGGEAVGGDVVGEVGAADDNVTTAGGGTARGLVGVVVGEAP